MAFIPIMAATEPSSTLAIRRPHKPASKFAATELFDLSTRTGNGAANLLSAVSVNFRLIFTYPQNAMKAPEILLKTDLEEQTYL